MERAAYDRMCELEETHWWFRARRWIVAKAIEPLALPSGARILEVGCGPGGNIAMLSQFGQVTPVEPDAPCRDYIRQKFGIEALPGALPDHMPASGGRFDMVCAFDVIEHVADDEASLRSLRPFVKDGGYIIATVPAYRWMWSRHDVTHHHKRRYTLKALETLFSSTGYEVVRASYFNTLLFPLAVLVRFAKALIGNTSDDDRLPGSAINRLLEQIFKSEAIWLRRASLPFGLSVLLVARPVATST